jgi:hypothetical protein
MNLGSAREGWQVHWALAGHSCFQVEPMIPLGQDEIWMSHVLGPGDGLEAEPYVRLMEVKLPEGALKLERLL